MSNSLIFRGQVFYQKQSIYALFIFPLVQLKKLFKLIYDFLLKLIWAELIKGENKISELANLVAFFLFCGFALLAHYFKNYQQVILIIFLSLWCLDYWIAKNQYLTINRQLPVTLNKSQDNSLTWIMTLPDKKVIKSKFLDSKIKEIALTQRSVYGGAFQELIGKVWQIELNLSDGSSLLIDEQKKVTEAVNQAQTLANNFNIPVVFSNSQGNSIYAASPLDADDFKNPINWQTVGIKCKKTQQKWHIYSSWRLQDSWVLLKQIFQESGFLVFVLIMINFLPQFGEFIYNFIALFISHEETVIDMSILLKSLIPNFNLINKIELTIAIGLMLFKGWQLSRVKHIYLDKHFLKFFIDNKKIEQMNTQGINSALFLNDYEPEILILSDNKAIKIPKFQQEENSRAYLLKLEEGLNFFNPFEGE